MFQVADRLLARWRRRYWRANATEVETTKTPFVVVTGGSRGIGKALATEFASIGYPILIVARTETDLIKAAAEIGASQPKHPVETLSLDITEDQGPCESRISLKR